MKKLQLLVIGCIAAVLVFAPAYAVVKKTAQTGLQFLKVDVGARASAMGGSYSMVGNDATAMFYNPAGLAKMEQKFHFFAAQTKWIAGISYKAFGLAYTAGNWGTFGLSGVMSDYGGDIIGTRYAGTEKGYVETGSIDVAGRAIGISYAKTLTNKFTLGGQIKLCYQNLGVNLLPNGTTQKNKVSGVAYDFGTIFYPGFKSFRLGMLIRNFSPEFKYVQDGFELPLTFTLGVAMDVMDFLGEHRDPLVVSVDAQHPRDYTERVNIGAEYTWMNMLSARAGYKFNHDVEGLTGGFGVKYKAGMVGLEIGYAYSDCEFFDAVNRVTIGISF